MTETTQDTIQQDVSNDTAFDDENALAAALFDRWNPDADKPSGTDEEEDKKPTETSEAAPEDKAVDEDQAEVEEEAEEKEDAEETDEPERAYVEDDGVYVKVKVGDEELEFPVKDLKRLAGQEASFTRKGQELAQQRKTVEDAATLQVQVFDRLLETARAAWEPFSQLDFLTLARNPDVSEEQLVAVRQEAERRYNELQFLENGLKQVSEANQKAVGERKAAAAKACVDALSDPLTGIEGFGEPLYNEMVTYALDQGIDKAWLNDLTDSGTFKLLHKAMLFDRGKAKVTEFKEKKAKNSKPPKKIVKTKSAKKAAGAVDDKATAASKKFEQTGSIEDAAAMMEARWSQADED